MGFLKFASLGSGSAGNSTLVRARSGATATTVMLDCGFSLRQTEERMARLGVTPAELSGIVVTHEHQDHIGGVFRLARRYRLPVWMSVGTFHAEASSCADIAIHHCRDGEPFSIGDIEFSPYTVPHDAREPLQFHMTDGQFKLGVLTDVGQATSHMIAALGGCDALMLECNHDLQMLADSDYPASLKRRIRSDYGHMSNQAAHDLLSALDQSRLKRVVGAHLSAANNTQALASAALMSALKSAHTEVRIACQNDGLAWTGVGV